MRYYVSNKRAYNIFACMKQRCNNPKNKDYKYYGGRGIKCEWRYFEHFWKDMRRHYHYKLSIDRKNCDGNYCKENCRWIPLKEQPKNRRPSSEWNFTKINLCR